MDVGVNHEEVSSISLRKKLLVTLEHVPFALMYSFSLYQCYETLGLPYATALEKYKAEDTGVPCMPLPAAYMPSFVARLYLAATVLLHVLMVLMQHWSVAFRCWLKYPAAPLTAATHVKVLPKAHKGKAALVPLQRTARGEVFFEFQKFKFFYSNATRSFAPIANPDSLPLGQYRDAGLDGDVAAAQLARRGLNQFEISMPSFGELYVEGLLAPFTVFQMFCVLLWCLDEYWQYSVFTAFMLLVFEGTVVMSRRKNLQTLRGMNNEPRRVSVRRDGEWRDISARELVPGDVVMLAKVGGVDGDVIPCDCLVLRGSAVVNEATLTGESVPQMKEAIATDAASADIPLDIRSDHKVHVLFGGTRILQCSGAETANSCLCYVLRTGFDSSQGQMVRMIEFSSEKVTGNTREALLLVLFLLIFALSASGYVLKRGLEDGRDQFDLLLHCVLIITSVIPAELNMQMALAVNASLLTLLRLHIFCTEPFRIPMAGKIDVCLFDKTGTLTTDELVAAGAVPWPAPGHAGEASLVPMSSLSSAGLVVVGACHSLVAVDGKTSGDPLELAALKAVGWEYSADTNIAQPAAASKAAKVTASIKLRHHFASKLQRMCTVARVRDADGPARLRVLVKGSPEMVGTLLGAGAAQPSRAWYDATYRALAVRGLRVIALAYANITEYSENDIMDLPREAYEKNLQFAGFIAFRCLLRKDSAAIIQGLKDSSHEAAMITGDALLTGIHVADEVHMLTKARAVSLAAAPGSGLQWEDAAGAAVAPLDPAALPALAADRDLCVTGETLARATELFPAFWDHVHLIKVFARMTPDSKERVVVELRARGRHPLMCGDGANDVGALKQADVGIALLSGFGSANASSADKDKAVADRERAAAEKAAAVAVPAAKKDPATLRREAQEKMAAKQADLQRRIAERSARGESWATLKEMYAFSQREAEERRKEMSKHATIASSAAAMLETDDGSVPMVKLGDASAAAPFTVKMPSIAAAIDIIRQGRCTLVTSLQMYQILALNCLISSYSLSILYLDGVKKGDKQMTVMGILMTVSYLSLSRATPLEKLGPVRPLNSIFHPAMFISLLGQFAIHVWCMASAVSLAKPFLPDNFQPSVDGTFEPNLINSVVFLMTCVQQVTVFAVNYKGPPFMDGLARNNALIGSLACVAVSAAAAAANVLPVLNTWLQLVEYPTQEFKDTFFKIILYNVAGVFLVDRLAVAVFAPRLLLEDLRGTSRADVMKIVKVVGLVTLLLFTLAVEPPPEYADAAASA